MVEEGAEVVEEEEEEDERGRDRRENGALLGAEWTLTHTIISPSPLTRDDN